MPTLRVMTFNVRGATHTQDGINIWKNRAELNVGTAKRYAPDLIGFQECQPGNLEAYLEQLRAYDCIAGIPTSNLLPEKHEYNAIFWRRDRFELLDSWGFWLSNTPAVWSGDWDTACVRGANWVKLRLKETGLEFLHLNTHLDHISGLARQEGSKLILRKLAELNAEELPLIITGDFNENAWNPIDDVDTATHHFFLENGFIDTYLAAGNTDSVVINTFHRFEGETYSAVQNDMSLRIDWILVRDDTLSLRTKSCLIVRDQEPPLYPSDHYPVLAEFVLIG
jgi:endonuclease/exonuclease/phosphatase family metal-dependent hydrolase